MAEPQYRAANRVAAGYCNDSTFLLNKRTGRYYRLDDVGGELWALLRRSPSLTAREIVQELSTIYEVAPQDIAGDVAQLIATLVGYAVIELESMPRRP
jgi:hypothetical protein